VLGTNSWAADVKVRKEYIDSTRAIDGFRKNAQLFLEGRSGQQSAEIIISAKRTLTARDARRVTEPDETENGFFPSGAIFFFVLLLLFYALLWLVIYGLMIARS
jgi:hypothetical protein